MLASRNISYKLTRMLFFCKTDIYARVLKALDRGYFRRVDLDKLLREFVIKQPSILTRHNGYLAVFVHDQASNDVFCSRIQTEIAAILATRAAILQRDNGFLLAVCCLPMHVCMMSSFEALEFKFVQRTFLQR